MVKGEAVSLRPMLVNLSSPLSSAWVVGWNLQYPFPGECSDIALVDLVVQCRST